MNEQAGINVFPKIHNAMWPGLVGKGSPGAEPCIDLDTMLELTARAEVDGVKFDGVDLFLYEPHISIDLDADGIKRLADKIRAKGFVVGSVVAPVWPPTGGGSAMGNQEERKRFVEQVRKACRIARGLREAGVRPYGVVRIDSACGVNEWAVAPEQNQETIASTFREACEVAAEAGERLAAEGEICWGGMHSWRKMLDLLERVDRPKTLGFQADMAHTLLYVLGYNAPEDALLPPDFDWAEPARLDRAMATLTASLRPWTIDFHVAQNDATVKGSGTHDKTGHHCLPTDGNGKLDVVRHAGYWLREDGKPTRAFRHICWDGCMFSNEVMMRAETWNSILRTLLAVRAAHGWSVQEAGKKEKSAVAEPTLVSNRRQTKRAVAAGRRSKKGKPATRRASAKVVHKTKPARQKPLKKGTVRGSRTKAVFKAKSRKARKAGKASASGRKAAKGRKR